MKEYSYQPRGHHCWQIMFRNQPIGHVKKLAVQEDGRRWSLSIAGQHINRFKTKGEAAEHAVNKIKDHWIQSHRRQVQSSLL